MSAKGRPPIVCRLCGATAPPGEHPDLDWCPVYDEKAAVAAGWSRARSMEWECGACAPQPPGTVADTHGVAEEGMWQVAVCIGDRRADTEWRLATPNRLPFYHRQLR